MPVGAAIAIGATAFGVGTLIGSKKSAPQEQPQQNTSSLVDAATAKTPPSVVQGASNATAQAGIAAQKQRKKAAAGDTLLTPQIPGGGYTGGMPKLQQRTLLGS